MALMLLFMALLAGGSLAQAQDVSFTASAPERVRLGEQFQYVIEGSKQGDVLLPEMESLQLMAGPFSSYSSHSQWVNGKMTMETVVSYTHIFRATEEGVLRIPATTVKVGRKEYQTNEVEIQVMAANAPQASQGGSAGSGGQGAGGSGDKPSRQGAAPDGQAEQGNDPVFLRILPSKREVYVGEQLVSELKVYTRVNTRPAAGTKDVPYEGFYKKSIDPDESARRQDIGGQQYVSQVIQRHILIPQKSGNLVIEPFESEWMVQQRVQRRSNSPFDSFFDDPFFSGVQEVPTTLATRPVTIKVKPLPVGAPAGFTGGVGSFQMKAELSAEEVTVNEALSLKLTISGTGNLPLLGEPQVNLPPDHDIYEVTRNLNTSNNGQRIRGSLTFEYPIVARHAGKFRIAPIRFAWFDPQKGEYLSLSSEEFFFTVLKGEGEEGMATGPVYVPGLGGESVENIGTDIRDLVRSFPQTQAPSSSLMGRGWYPLAYLALALVSLLIIAFMRVSQRRNADVRLVRNRQASKAARTRLRKAEKYLKSEEDDQFYEEVGKAIWGYLGDKLGVETSQLNRELIAARLEERGLEEDLMQEYNRILEESEFSRFAPSAQKSRMQDLYRDAATLIRNLESKLS